MRFLGVKIAGILLHHQLNNMKNLFNSIYLFALAGSLLVLASCGEDDGGSTIPPINPDTETVVVSGYISQNTTWTADKIYELAGYVVVDSGATLTIEAGTIVKARTGSGAASSALVIARNAMINAQGSASAPIVFTSVLDNIQPGELVGSSLSADDAGLWGGVIILGNAPVSTGSGDTEGQIEGISSDYTFGRYGGNDPTDNSGVFSYVSIRHNGTEIAPDSEIQGLTTGGVGSGTQIDHIEIVASDDDGVEFFGGTHDISHLLVVNHADDGIDLDQSYAGTISNFFVTHTGGKGSNAGFEFDGPEGSTYTAGKYTVQNGTLKNTGGPGRAMTLKSGSQGDISGVWVTGYGEFVTVEGGSANANFAAGELTVSGCEFNSADISDLSMGAIVPEGADSVASISSFAAANATAAAPGNAGATTSEFDGWTWGASAGLVEN